MNYKQIKVLCTILVLIAKNKIPLEVEQVEVPVTFCFDSTTD